jgi:CheY-like chemotaxis protein
MNRRSDPDVDEPSGRQSPRILVCDDNDVDRFAVRHALRESGIASIVRDTASVSEALEELRHMTFDCVFIGDSTARTHLFSLLLALNQMGYGGRVVIVAYGVAHAAAQNVAVPIGFLSIASLTPQALAEGPLGHTPAVFLPS